MIIIICLLYLIRALSTMTNPMESDNKGVELDVSSNLNTLKKNAINEVIQKMTSDSGLFSRFQRRALKKYFETTGKGGEKIEDFFIELFGLAPKEAREFRENLNKAETKEAIDQLLDSTKKSIEETKASVMANSKASAGAAAALYASTRSSASSSSSSRRRSTSSTPSETSADAESYAIDPDVHLINIPEEVRTLYEQLQGRKKPDLEPFACALTMYNKVKEQGRITNDKYMTIVDFTKKKGTQRFFVINMETHTVEHAVKVGHGKKSGGDWATQFSDNIGSNQSSLGGYLLPSVITKSPNKSWEGLRQITGLEDSNDNAAQRGIAVHAGGENGSEGCFTLPSDISRTIMEKIKGSFLFAYAKSRDYFAQSNYFSINSSGEVLAAA